MTGPDLEAEFPPMEPRRSNIMASSAASGAK